MLTNDLISKLISLQEQANDLLAKIQHMQNSPKKEREASRHQRKIDVLNSNIQRIIKRIAAGESEQRVD